MAERVKEKQTTINQKEADTMKKDTKKVQAAEIEKTNTTRRESSRFLKYILTRDELHDLGNTMARKVTERDALEDEITSTYAAKINAAQAEAHQAARLIQNGYDMRQIDCEEESDFTHQTIRITRLDTGEIVEERTMTNYELQQSIFDEPQVVVTVNTDETESKEADSKEE